MNPKEQLIECLIFQQLQYCSEFFFDSPDRRSLSVGSLLIIVERKKNRKLRGIVPQATELFPKYQCASRF